MEAFKQASEPVQSNNGRQQQQQAGGGNDWRDQPQVRSKSPVVPNPPVYMPTLQEQWMAKKMAKQQQQQGSAPRPAPPPPQRQVSSSGQGSFYPQPQYTQTPAEQTNQLFQRQVSSSSASSSSRTNQEVIIPVRVEPRDGNSGNRNVDGGQGSWPGHSFADQPPSPRYTGAAFPSKAFQAVRLLTGEDPFFSTPNNFSLPSSYNSFTPTGN